jgi:hypothetical protein
MPVEVAVEQRVADHDEAHARPPAASASSTAAHSR